MKLSCTRGETPSWTIDCLRNGVALDLTGATIVFAAKALYSDTVAVIDHDNGGVGGISVAAPPTAGICTLTFAAADTTQFPDTGRTTLVWDLRVTEANGNKTVVAAGTLSILPSVA